jgi:hypothetical protein
MRRKPSLAGGAGAHYNARNERGRRVAAHDVGRGGITR